MRSRTVKWTDRALNDLRGFHEWLSTLRGSAPEKTIGQIRTAAESLSRLGDIGRPSLVPGLRELSVRLAPYVVVYRVSMDQIEIVAVYHTAQSR